MCLTNLTRAEDLVNQGCRARLLGLQLLSIEERDIGAENNLDAGEALDRQL